MKLHGAALLGAVVAMAQGGDLLADEGPQLRTPTFKCFDCGAPDFPPAPYSVPQECVDADEGPYDQKPDWPGAAVTLPTPEEIEAACGDLLCSGFDETVSPLHATGLAVAGFFCDGEGGDDGCQYKDVVVANGNDALRQRIYGIDNLGGELGSSVGWFSCDVAFNGNVAAGDIDGDGDNDLVVATFFDPSQRLNSGTVKIYQKEGSTLERCPSKVLRIKTARKNGGVAIGVDLGDVNGDGRLDIFAAVGGYERMTGKGNMTKIKPSKSFLFTRRPAMGLKFRRTETDQEYHSGDAHFADIDLDGRMDLSVSTRRQRVFWGNPSGAALDLSLMTPKPFNPERRGSYGTSVGPTPVAATDGTSFLPLAWSANAIVDLGSPLDTPQPFRVHLPQEGGTSNGGTPSWRSKSKGSNSKVLLTHVHEEGTANDPSTDLIATRWSERLGGTNGSPIRIYTDVTTANRAAEPVWCSADPYVGQEIEVADLDRGEIVRRNVTVTINADQPVVTLPGRVERVVEVVDPNDETQKFTAFASVPGRNFVGFAASLHGQTVKIYYETSHEPDLLVSDWNGDNTAVVFEHD